MASVERRGDGYRVRWYEGRVHRSETFKGGGDLKKARKSAKAFARRKEDEAENPGVVAFEAGVPFEDFYGEWLLDREDELSARTFAAYTTFLRAHVADHLGHVPIGHITPRRLDDWRRERLASGAGRTSIGQTITLLKQIFKRAVVLELIPRNPAEALDRPKAPKKRQVPDISAKTTEALRAWMLERERDQDAAYISVLAYAGLRPGEALALRWDDINERVMHVYAPKTDKHRRVRVEPHLHDDLMEWKDKARPGGLVFPRNDRTQWRDTDFRNWRNRVFYKAALDVGLKEWDEEKEEWVPTIRPYDLRHFRASHLIYQGKSVTEVAQQMGHSPQVCLSTYAHAFEDPPESDPTEWISEVRTPDVPKTAVEHPKRRTRGHAKSLHPRRGSRRPDSNRGPLHYESRIGPRSVLDDATLPTPSPCTHARTVGRVGISHKSDLEWIALEPFPCGSPIGEFA